MYQGLISRAVRPRRSRNSAFTLIELLVVIAIIAILAAILFPVFAQARAKARQANDQSNLKQEALCIIMYAQDYDDTYPAYQLGYNYTEPPITNTVTANWLTMTMPYRKTWNIEWDNQEKWNPFGIWGSPTLGFYGNEARFTAYAYNYDYMDINSTCDLNAAPFGTSNPHPLPMAKVVSPAQMIMFCDGKTVGTSAGAYATFGTDAPAAFWSPNTCCYGNGGWGSGSYGDTINYAAPNNTGTGLFSPRYSGGGNCAFVDGHVKWLTSGGAAAGTDWKITSTEANITVINANAYLWCFDPNIL